MKEKLIKCINEERFFVARQMIDEILLLSGSGRTSIYYIVENAIAYMKEKYKEELTLSQVATCVGVTPNYLSKIFLRHVGVNFSTYLNFLRVREAEILLLKTELQVTNISDAVGFADTSYFIRVFKRYTHCTPTQFRYYYNSYKEELLKNAH